MILGEQRQELEIKSQANRFYFLIFLAGLFFLILLSRLVFLQIYQGENLREFSKINQFKRKVLIAPRGFILDRNGEVLAGNKKISQLSLSLNQPKSLEEILSKVSQILNEPVESLKQKMDISQKRYTAFHPVVLKENLNLEQAHRLKQLEWIYPEISVGQVEKRFYPLKDNASQLFGFIGLISPEEIKKRKQINQAVYLLDVVGKSGLEKLYDKHLKGENGWSGVEVDAKNRLFYKGEKALFDFFREDPKQGKDLHLTLDKQLQAKALEALRRPDALYPRTGAVIVMKNNGEILSLVSEPGFDANLLSSGQGEDLWKQWSAKESKVFINKAYQESYSPGSAFKPFVALAGLQEGLIDEDTLIESPGKYRLGSRVFHDHNRQGYGKIHVLTAIERSSNTFFYQLAKDLGINLIDKYARLFLFGSKTQFDLQAEVSGTFPTAQKRKTDLWQKGDTLNIAIGQGPILSTLLQMTVAYNAIATEGKLVQPFLVKKGEASTQPKVLDILTDRIDRKHFVSIKKALKQVVNGKAGTARGYRLAGLSFSGKTGTTQVVSLSAKGLYKDCKLLPKKLRHHGWFIGFAPSDKPEIVVSAFTQNSCSGSRGSASVVKDIIEFYFKQKGLSQ